MEIIGIDIGSSGTKMTGYRRNGFEGNMRFPALSSKSELLSQLNYFIGKNGFSDTEIEKIVVTGIKSNQLDSSDFKNRLLITDEFTAMAHGGLVTSGTDSAYVISMGTGTAFVRAEKIGNTITASHIGGTGIGGGFLCGLAGKICGVDEIGAISALGKKGDAGRVDLRLGDLRDDAVGILNPEITVANFGKIESDASEADYAAAILTAVYQIIGMLAVFAMRLDEIKKFVLIGALAELSEAREVFARFADVYGIDFTIPAEAEFSVAKGAVLSALQ